MLRFSLRHKILVGYIILVSVIFCMILTILYEKHQIQKIESETFEIRTLRQNINTIYRYITMLSISSENVMDWKETVSENTQICLFLLFILFFSMKIRHLPVPENKVRTGRCLVSGWQLIFGFRWINWQPGKKPVSCFLFLECRMRCLEKIHVAVYG